MNFWEYSYPTYIENWPNSVKSLSFADVDIPLTLEEARALGTNIHELGEGFIPLTPEQEAQNEWAIRNMADFVKLDWKPYDISSIVLRLDEAVSKFPNGAFVRLGSRSPKDAFISDKERRITSGKAAVKLLCACSERISDDLHLAIAHSYAPHIFVRQWVDIPKWQEFRCFMKSRKLVGISQYNYFDALPELQNEETGSKIRFGIECFFPKLKEASHLDDTIFDVWVKMLSHGNETAIECKLIEINPYFEMTDPCLFDWHNTKNMNGDFLIKHG